MSRLCAFKVDSINQCKLLGFPLAPRVSDIAVILFNFDKLIIWSKVDCRNVGSNLFTNKISIFLFNRSSTGVTRFCLKSITQKTCNQRTTNLNKAEYLMYYTLFLWHFGFYNNYTLLCRIGQNYSQAYKVAKRRMPGHRNIHQGKNHLFSHISASCLD